MQLEDSMIYPHCSISTILFNLLTGNLQVDTMGLEFCFCLRIGKVVQAESGLDIE